MKTAVKTGKRSRTSAKAPVSKRVGARREGRGGRPTKAEAQAIEDRILSVAAELFARDGYAATSMERVVSECGAGKDTIYRRYPSKRAIFDAVLERSRRRIMALLADLQVRQSGQNSLAQLKELASCLLDINLDPELVAFKRIAASEMMVAPGNDAEPAPDAIMSLLRASVTKAQSDQRLVSGDTNFLTDFLINSIIVGPTTLAMFGFKPLASAKERKLYFDKAWKLFLGGAVGRQDR
ncbi:TetR/AcrR family transcriptional regulator [Bradyrhizobium iriomotense]|uniref:TetR/AcrR family transcriptional regulator n=1 Tax=Bradyrhizobium iriomotense TaxID=441950 RepID=UPI001B89EBA1|nr:TetR/AcrR family transcriptional regulator [Bradyrhizobium iriomotense]MBR0784888.1 TetR/AcrR family transcriptional regulator [Bradyrhizobium iriomotense]